MEVKRKKPHETMTMFGDLKGKDTFDDGGWVYAKLPYTAERFNSVNLETLELKRFEHNYCVRAVSGHFQES